MVNQFFLTKVFKATFPINCGETDGAWNLGLKVPVLRLQYYSPMVMTFPWRPSLANDGSAIVRRRQKNSENNSFKLRIYIFMWSR